MEIFQGVIEESRRNRGESKYGRDGASGWVEFAKPSGTPRVGAAMAGIASGSTRPAFMRAGAGSYLFCRAGEAKRVPPASMNTAHRQSDMQSKKLQPILKLIARNPVSTILLLLFLWLILGNDFVDGSYFSEPMILGLLAGYFIYKLFQGSFLLIKFGFFIQSIDKKILTSDFLASIAIAILFYASVRYSVNIKHDNKEMIINNIQMCLNENKCESNMIGASGAKIKVKKEYSGEKMNSFLVTTGIQTTRLVVYAEENGCIRIRDANAYGFWEKCK